MNLLDALDRASGEFRDRLALVGAADWARTTPCDEWDVRFLVAHVVGGNRFATDVLSGTTARLALESVMSRPQLGIDPLIDYDASTVQQRASFRRHGALDSICDHLAGAITGEQFLVMRVFDISVHAWDLADALAQDDHLDEALCSTVLSELAGLADDSGFGIVPIGRATERDDPQTRLLDVAGRSR